MESRASSIQIGANPVSRETPRSPIRAKPIIDRFIELTGADPVKMKYAIESFSPLTSKARSSETNHDSATLSGFWTINERINSRRSPFSFLVLRHPFGSYEGERLYAEIVHPSELRTDPYHDRCTTLNPNRSTIVRDGALFAAIYSGLAILNRIITGDFFPSWFNRNKGFGLVAATALAITVKEAASYLIARLTWKKQIAMTYNIVDKYGVDGYLTMLTRPWRTQTMELYLKWLETIGIINESGFTEKGEAWYAKKFIDVDKFLV